MSGNPGRQASSRDHQRRQASRGKTVTRGPIPTRGIELELLAVRCAAALLPDISGYMSVNFSPRAILDERCLELLSGLPVERVVLELSEHEPIENYSRLADVLGPLRSRGLRLAIEDVGAGFSSLRHIVVTSPDMIKLDRSIVDGIATDPVLRTLVNALVDFGHGSGARVVAEGVETKDDAIALRSAGIDYAQGWYFARADTSERLADSYRVDDLFE